MPKTTDKEIRENCKMCKLVDDLAPSMSYCAKHKYFNPMPKNSTDKKIKIIRRTYRKRLNCLNCGEPMRQVKDEIAKKFTGHLWRCEKCMSKGKVLSIG